jgi:outer membrane protein OmpA-like peptidoglycan-associated protein
MQLKSLLFVGAIAPFVAVPQIGVAAERQSEIVVAQQQSPDAKRDDEKRQRPDAKQPERRQPAKPSAQNAKPAAPDTKPAAQNTKPAAQQPAADRKEDGKRGRAPAAQNAEPEKPAERPRRPAAAKPAEQQKPAAAQPAQQQKPAAQQKPRQSDDKNARGRQGPQDRQRQDAQDQQRERADTAQRNRRIEDVRKERKETREGNRTVIRESSRTIIKENGRTIIRHDEVERFRRSGGNVQVTKRGTETVNTIVRPGGVRVVDVVDSHGRLVRRSRWVNGREIILINNNYGPPRPGFSFIVTLPPPVIRIPRDHYIVEADRADRALLYATLIAPPVDRIERPYTLEEIRYSPAVRERMPRIDLDTVTFDTGSWELTPDQGRLLAPIAAAMKEAIDKNPNEIYLIEGHTDAVGSEEDNLSLSDRRAEAVAEVLSENFGIPPENLTTQGYGEQNLKVPVQGPERRNRRVTVRRITPLLMGKS